MFKPPSLLFCSKANGLRHLLFTRRGWETRADARDPPTPQAPQKWSESLSATSDSRPEYWSGSPLPFPEDLPTPGIKPRSPTSQVDSLPAEPQGKPKNTREGSLSLLQGIFLMQELNQGLLHCRRILYQLSYQGNPEGIWGFLKLSEYYYSTQNI